MRYQLKVLVEFEATDTPEARQFVNAICSQDDLIRMASQAHGASRKLQKLEEGKPPVGIRLEKPEDGV